MSTKTIMFVTNSFMHMWKAVEELRRIYILCKTKEGVVHILKYLFING